MKFMISVIDTQTRPPHTPQEISAIDAFNDKLQAAGQRVLAIGLDSPKEAMVIDARNNSLKSSSGPLHETNEYQSGIWIIEVADHETAIQLAEEGSRACNRKVELRPVLG
jgi:hypothetical protein